MYHQNYSKTVIVWNITTIKNYFSIHVIYSSDGKAEFSAAIIPVFGIALIFQKSF